MQENKKISQSLIELSDAIEQLTMVIANQDNSEENSYAEQFSLLVEQFNEATQQINSVAGKSEEITLKHDNGFIEKWLKNKGIYVGKSISALQVDQKLYNVADYLSEHYSQLKDFYKNLKKWQNLKHDFKANTTIQSVDYIRNWCEMLHRNKIIDSFQFLNNKLVDIDIAEIHKATYFINGNWLEMLLRNELAKLLKANIHRIESFDILAQVEIMKANHNNSEIDLFLMINKKIYWFECKSGDVTQVYFNRFAEHRKLFKLPYKRSFLVIPAKNNHLQREVKSRSGMQTIYATEIEKQLRKLIFD